jgi:uncharacterized membrane protein YdjX (TVP38/TMEM64 family)
MSLPRPSAGTRSAVSVGIVLALIAAGVFARSALGIEWNAESVRQVVNDLGLWGPAILVLLLTLRQVLLIPSQILLIAGGLCFGAVAGTLYGAVGLALSGSMVFALTRWLGNDYVISRIPERLRWALQASAGRTGALFVFVGTGYPVGPVTAFHAGAALTGMTFLVFLAVVAAGSLVRSATFTFFGSTLVEGAASQLFLAAAVVVVVSLLPALHPRTRAWVRHQIHALATRHGDPGKASSDSE